MYNKRNPFNLLYFSWDIFTYVTAGICNKWLSWLHSLSSVATYWIYQDTTVTTHFRSFISIESARLVCDTSSCPRCGAARCGAGLWVYDPLKTNLNKPGLFYETGPWMMKQKQTAKQLKQKKQSQKGLIRMMNVRMNKENWKTTTKTDLNKNTEPRISWGWWSKENWAKPNKTELNKPKNRGEKVLRILLQIEQNNTKNKITLKKIKYKMNR